ncbi:ATP-dependent sacrificial sulfur transferase LarE [Candidatus Formimonas warabiya]|uniref:TIGR00268 family protein n=1 Tax=Formimonas warabiya TaxID=1761012 RepID=A0A3G1L2R7_FORW1|nr:ATP-dependent sacrificial sulfur transferase LarE [Candidatus Formimonas warabiya]ATW28957.1 TIGR00268 family protein [Candidatus Formimonas warabiya]
MTAQEKLALLKSNLQSLGHVMIAFSGGVDSTFLLKAAHDVLGNAVTAVTARSATFPEREFHEATDFIQKLGIKHLVVLSEELEINGFSDNPPNRCYLCKKELFSKIRKIADEQKIEHIADGSNLDDLKDYRPGRQALQELGIISPLRDAGLTKEDIRILSREMDLPTWNKPAFACLSSRFPYGEKITKEKLAMVDQAEQYLIDLGFNLVRVRCHGTLARIEVAIEARSKFFSQELMDQVYQEFKKIGFIFVCLDLKGYRTGSMNATLPQ